MWRYHHNIWWFPISAVSVGGGGGYLLESTFSIMIRDSALLYLLVYWCICWLDVQFRPQGEEMLQKKKNHHCSDFWWPTWQHLKTISCSHRDVQGGTNKHRQPPLNKSLHILLLLGHCPPSSPIKHTVQDCKKGHSMSGYNFHAYKSCLKLVGLPVSIKT